MRTDLIIASSSCQNCPNYLSHDFIRFKWQDSNGMKNQTTVDKTRCRHQSATSNLYHWYTVAQKPCPLSNCCQYLAILPSLCTHKCRIADLFIPHNVLQVSIYTLWYLIYFTIWGGGGSEGGEEGEKDKVLNWAAIGWAAIGMLRCMLLITIKIMFPNAYLIIILLYFERKLFLSYMCIWRSTFIRFLQVGNSMY